MKRIIVFMAVLQLGAGLFAQSIDDIKHSGNYLWGEGSGKTINVASKEALSDLISKITVDVSSEFVKESGETDDNYTERVSSIVKTY